MRTRIPFPAVPTAFILCAVGGFGMTGAILRKPPESISGTPEYCGVPDSLTPAEQGKPTGLPGGGAQPLAARLRVALEVLGISGDWAEKLAAGDATGFPALLKRMDGLPGRQREQLRGLLFGRWTELDPVGGASLLAGDPLHDDLTDFLKHWARLDFEAAAAWAEKTGPDLMRRTARDHALLDPQDFLRWLGGRPDLNPVTLFDSDSRENLLALRRLTERDPQRMLAWSRALPEEKLKPEFLRDLGAGLAKADPDKAMEWARSLKDTARSDAALAGVAGELAVTNPRKALEIAAAMKASGTYDPGEMQYRIVRKLDLANADQMQALLSELPASAFRNALAKRVTIEQLERDPAKAFSMAAELGPEAGMLHPIEIPWGMAVSEESARKLLDAAALAPPPACGTRRPKRLSCAGWKSPRPLWRPT